MTSSFTVPDDALDVLADWQRRMHAEEAMPEDRRARAFLRRCRSLDAVRSLGVFWEIERDVRRVGYGPASEQDRNAYLDWLALVVRLLPYVEKASSAGGALARLAGTPGSGERARMSDLRFRRLLQVETRAALFAPLVRTLRLLGTSDEPLNLRQLARDLRRWPYARTDWARDYYTATLAPTSEA